VEFQVHGGPVLLDLVLAEALALGARLAEPGEFTRRAFLNDKLDLAQAEAVADLIEASTESAARAAVASLSGAFSQAVNALHEAMVELRCYVEGARAWTSWRRGSATYAVGPARARCSRRASKWSSWGAPTPASPAS